MGRENCMMCSYLGNVAYCDYYDVFFMKCENLEQCPDGLDDDDGFDYDYDFNEDIFNEDY